MDILQNFSEFHVVLSAVALFPVTNILYLDVAEGNSTIHLLHKTLNQDVLADKEQYPFIPHVTLGGPLEELHAEDIQRLTSEAWQTMTLPSQFLLREVVALWADAGPTEETAWRRIWTYHLDSKASENSTWAASGRTS